MQGGMNGNTMNIYLKEDKNHFFFTNFTSRPSDGKVMTYFFIFVPNCADGLNTEMNNNLMKKRDV